MWSSFYLLAFENDLQTASCLIFIGAIFDFLDGFVARFLNVSSEIGKQLDSFADIITFGVAPGFIIFHLIDEKLEYTFYKLITISLVAAITPILSAFRLALLILTNIKLISLLAYQLLQSPFFLRQSLLQTHYYFQYLIIHILSLLPR